MAFRLCLAKSFCALGMVREIRELDNHRTENANETEAAADGHGHM